MNYSIINSGSDGNAVVVEDVILIDCGVSFKKLQQIYQKLELVLLTHIHEDHFNKLAIKKLAELRPGLRFGCCEWLVDELLALGVQKSRIDVYTKNVEYDYGKFKISTFELFHDVPQCGYKVFMNNKKLIYATDTKSIEHIEAKDYDVYLIEANYENEEKLHEYAYSLDYETRVKNTHLSKEQTIKWLLDNMSETSIYEFMHQHKEKPLAQRFILIKPLLKQVSEITNTDYELTDVGIFTAMEEILNMYIHLKDEKESIEYFYKENTVMKNQEDCEYGE